VCRILKTPFAYPNVYSILFKGGEAEGGEEKEWHPHFSYLLVPVQVGSLTAAFPDGPWVWKQKKLLR